MGSVPPALAFEEDGPQGQHPTGIAREETLTTSVGSPLTLTVWVSDPSQRLREALGELYEDLVKNYETHPEQVARMVPGSRAREPAVEETSPVETAAWIAVARVVLNLDEVVTRS